MSDIKESISQVALGKAHVLALTNKGQVFTFGINHKGQCGREFIHGANREGDTIINLYICLISLCLLLVWQRTYLFSY